MKRVIGILRAGGVGVLATDTLYGVVAPALDRATVERVYQLKHRRPSKPCIILIGRYEDLAGFGIEPTAELRQQLSAYWPGPVSVILPCPRADLAYLHRGTRSLAFRLPGKPALRRFLRQAGPLIAPSANPEGLPPAATLAEARAYFGDAVDFYRRGRTSTRASKLIQIAETGHITVLRD
ncbi:MAG TPA: L-threonylcarbamoyladenylate synthase [Candidatus Saccharimonadia bacterium]|nr:L-threonylcarbamoyladenylate synthase [Candidatus Saccharimonadia bacterium]